MKPILIELNKINVRDRARKEMGDLEELADGLREKGQLQAIGLDKDNNLLWGGRRVAAANLLMTSEGGYIKGVPQGKIWAIKWDLGDDHISAKEIELMENIQRKDFTWPERAKLEKEIHDHWTAKDPGWSLRKQGKLVDASVGAVHRRIQLAEYLKVVPELEECSTQDEAFKAVKKMEEAYMVQALTEQAQKAVGAGQVGAHRIMAWADNSYNIGDATQLIGKVKAGCCHFAEVDPPYGIGLNERKARNQTGKNKVESYQEIPAEEYEKFIQKMAEGVFRALYKDSFCVWWFGQEWYHIVLAELVEAGFNVNAVPAIWFKGGAGQTNSPDTMLASSYESFFVCRKGQPKLAKPGRSNVFQYSPVPHMKKSHSTEKPIELMVELLDTFVFPGSRLLVPFLGSGVTLRAAWRKNHVGFGWDLSEQHKKAFITKLQEDFLMGVKPELQKAVGEE
jgi:site-specific DNA-methyltransferase (adenine-specific)